MKQYTGILRSISRFFEWDNYHDCVQFWLLFLSIFAKCVLFHYFCFGSILISSIFTHPVDSFLFYAPKLLAALFVGSWIFLARKKWWSVIILLLVDVWAISNLIYYRANGFFVDVNAIFMLGNLRGFESSIGTFFLPRYIIFLLITFIYAIGSCLLGRSSKVYWKKLALCMCVVVGCNLLLCIPAWRTYIHDRDKFTFDLSNGRDSIREMYGIGGWRIFEPFHEIKVCAHPDFVLNYDYAEDYIKENSIVHYFAAIWVYYLKSEKFATIQIDHDIEQKIVDKSAKLQASHPTSNLIILLVESFESWTLDIPESIITNPCSNLSGLKSSYNSIVFSNVKSEAKHGVSGDGQMIVCTGLLPVNAGAACMLYGDHEYPSIAENYEHSVFIDVADGCWNQRVMTRRYGFSHDCYAEDTLWDDRIVFEQLCNVLDTIEEPFCVLALTGAMHSPFNRYHTENLHAVGDMPRYMKDYLECLFFTDSCFGIFWEKYQKSHVCCNTNVVITGDHTVFKQPILKDFSSYAQSQNWTLPEAESFCPLIINSPFIHENTLRTDTCYQMDIFPTIMHLVGCGNYYWKGFGVDLLDSIHLGKRDIIEEDAYRYSDMMIRADYFQTVNDDYN